MGFSGLSAGRRRSVRAREAVQRGAIEPEEGPKTPHRAFVPGQNAPVRAMPMGRPPTSAGGIGPYNERIRPGPRRRMANKAPSLRVRCVRIGAAASRSA